MPRLFTRLPGLWGAALALAILSPVCAAPAEPRAPAPVLNTSNILDTVGGLAVVLALLLGLAWLVKRYMTAPGVGKGRIQVVGGVSLGPRERAVIVEVDGERLLLGVAQGNVRMLHRLENDVPAQQEFTHTLAQVQEQQEPVQ
jgi:flagellar protein FliO/FliZ